MALRPEEHPMTITYAADYYPYGKILREWAPCEAERFLTTQHERDSESGYDNRGARLYDADVGRFLSVDPLAQDFAAYSGYNYVLGNPVKLVDPDGRSPDDIFYFNQQGELINRVETDQPDQFMVMTGDYTAEGPNLIPMPVYSEITMDSDLGHMARTIYAEGAGQSQEAKVALGEVIRNRAEDDTPSRSSNNYNAQFSDVSTFEEVVTQSGQFESVSNNVSRYADPLTFIGGDGAEGSVRNETRTSAFVESVGAAIKATEQNTNTAGGATYFFSPYIATPSWASTMTEVSVTGVSSTDFKFYRY